MTQPDGASTTKYAYSGNQTTVTDPAGKWKTLTTDVQGNLTAVTEPDPSSNTGGTLTTSYTYDWMNHLTGVSMPRGGITQTRSFVYNDAGLLISATNPESGTVTYTYSADNTLNYKHDAKGQDTVYTYDVKKRVTMIQRYPRGKTAQEDISERVVYQYDTNTEAPVFAQYLTGRLATAQYMIVDENGNPSPVTEMYSYHPAGAVTAKRLTAMGCGEGDGLYDGMWVQQMYGCSPAYVEADYVYNSAGQVATYGMARNSSAMLPTDPTYTYVYDAMGRPTTLTDNRLFLSDGYEPNTVWAKNAQYDFAGRMTSLQTFSGLQYGGTWLPSYDTETSTWNVNGQLASRGWISSIYSASASGTVQYTYSATQNNGQITQVSDSLSGETVTYQYDSLKRLVSATSAPNAGTTPAAWTQTFQYDGFGNLTAKVLNGNTTAIPVNGSTNRLANAVYDANGNMTSGAGVMPGYDVANRMTSAQLVSGGTEYYGYAPDNKRIYRRKPAGGYTGTEWTFYGAYGEKLGVFNLGGSPFGASFQVLHASVWFAGRLVAEDATNPFASGLSAVRRDRLGSNRAGGARFYPYGEEMGTATPNDRTKFAPYTRDGVTGLDYADQRYYASSYGRFTTADPSNNNVNPVDPRSWNSYSYVNGDPANANDPSGLGFWSRIWQWLTGRGYEGGDSDIAVPPARPVFVAPTYVYREANKNEQKSSLDRAGSLAERLLANPDCAELFNVGGVGMDPATLLQKLLGDDDSLGSITFGFIADPSASAMTKQGIGAPPDAGPIAIIRLNNDREGDWFLQEPLQQAGTLLHELGHAYNFIYGAGASKIANGDNPNTLAGQALQDANQTNIYDKCLSGAQQ